MKPSKEIQAGDIILTDRGLYKHYGIYAGKGKVIHYAARNGDFGLDVGVRETCLEQFTADGNYSIVQFKRNNTGEKHFSGKETLRRAQSRIGEKSYNLLFNNCEHFALWCKTGKSKSIQVEKAVTAAIVLGTVAIASQLVKSKDRNRS
jgi:cell wall-associated NlpC family hydrolase